MSFQLDGTLFYFYALFPEQDFAFEGGRAVVIVLECLVFPVDYEIDIAADNLLSGFLMIKWFSVQG